MIGARTISTKGTPGVRPWDSEDSKAMEPKKNSGIVSNTTHPGELYYRADKREDIEKCLNCKWPECRNCLGQYV